MSQFTIRAAPWCPQLLSHAANGEFVLPLSTEAHQRYRVIVETPGGRMKRGWHIFDRFAGRIYTRVLAVVTAAISAVMLICALVAWWVSGPIGGLVWLAGALLFGAIARGSWRSQAALSDVDFTL
jgi:hypothetical protein